MSDTARGRMVVISGPSGSGKSSICDRLLGMEDLRAQLSISATTRKPRPGEVHGKHYLFLSEAEFRRMEVEGRLLESAEVFGFRYGTPRGPIDKAIREGKTVLLDIDFQGARQLREKGVDALYIFVAPPSLQVLEERLRGRRTESEEALQRRLDGARRELAARDEYDLCVVNDHLARVSDEVRQAILSIKGGTGS